MSEFKWVRCKSADEVEAFFRERLPAMRQAAKDCGYALAVHGSMRRDLDLVAVPWGGAYLPEGVLAAAVQRAACGTSQQADSYKWELKPHGRVATCFPVCLTEELKLSNGHVDLSVMLPDSWELRKHLKEETALRERLSEILTQTANALHGGPMADGLPELAQSLWKPSGDARAELARQALACLVVWRCSHCGHELHQMPEVKHTCPKCGTRSFVHGLFSPDTDGLVALLRKEAEP